MPYFQHGNALDANTEGEAGILIRVNVAVLQHLAVDNTAAQNFDPAGVLAQGQPLPPHSKQLTSTSTLGSVKGK